MNGSPNSLMRYLSLLSQEYPNRLAANAEIINLKTILRLPKGTEYFFSDLHGEHRGFLNMLKSASGAIRFKVEALFGESLALDERILLSQLVYQPEEILSRLEDDGKIDDAWYADKITKLVMLLKVVSAKYTRSKVRKRLPKAFRYAIDELCYLDEDESRESYHRAVINAILETGMAQPFLCSLSDAVRQLSVDRLHILGDIFDRGPHADLIMDELMNFHDVDIQWGNHDIHWMGAALGNTAMVASVVRLGILYNTFDLLEDSYGINLRPLSAFAEKTYSGDACELFIPRDAFNQNLYDTIEQPQAARMHKAIAVIQFKLEGQLIKRHPEYQMKDRDCLSRVDWEKGLFQEGDKSYPLKDCFFPTIDPKDPLALNPAETELMNALTASFQHCERLQKHIDFLFSHGALYKIVNGNLLYHGCVPMNEDASLEVIKIGGNSLSGRAYFDELDAMVRRARFAPLGSPEQCEARDLLWYLWCGPKSPLFGKNRMTTFERYLIADKALHKETMNPYYALVEGEEACQNVLSAFGMDPFTDHIINGHVPVKILKGESPVKGKGRLFMIDGGISKAYQGTTGIAGYTLIFNSHFLALAQHPTISGDQGTLFDSPILKEVERLPRRRQVEDTDQGPVLKMKIKDLECLIEAYRSGALPER